jgi:hypothetical protein
VFAVDGPDAPHENVIELVHPPASRVWVALWIALGAALLAAAVILSSAELILALKSPMLEAIAPPRSP